LVGLNKFISQPATAWARLLLTIEKLMTAPGKKNQNILKYSLYFVAWARLFI
jgi:hypothetical protein